MKNEYDYVIIGGGFFGCCLALFLRSISAKILLVESESCLLNKASKTNQGRIHTGFHYPRSGMTALKSLLFHRRFISDFPEAIESSFQMLYAVARQKSKVTANRFLKQFEEMGAPIKTASSSERKLFQSNMIEDVFRCEEYAFNYLVIRDEFFRKISLSNIDLSLNTTALSVHEIKDGVIVNFSSGTDVKAKYVFNVTYSKINELLPSDSNLKKRVKHELAEIALIEPPDELAGLAVTVMDGPFFSTMPYPSTNLYSLSHVQYTPHYSFLDNEKNSHRRHNLNRGSYKIKAPYMIADSKRFMPCMSQAQWRESKYEIKTVLLQNEHDDGRPILYYREHGRSRVISILGGKLDNVYDLFGLMNSENFEWGKANTKYLFNS